MNGRCFFSETVSGITCIIIQDSLSSIGQHYSNSQCGHCWFLILLVWWGCQVVDKPLVSAVLAATVFDPWQLCHLWQLLSSLITVHTQQRSAHHHPGGSYWCCSWTHGKLLGNVALWLRVPPQQQQPKQNNRSRDTIEGYNVAAQNQAVSPTLSRGSFSIVRCVHQLFCTTSNAIACCRELAVGWLLSVM